MTDKDTDSAGRECLRTQRSEMLRGMGEGEGGGVDD